MHLVGFLGTGPTSHRGGGWRHPAAETRLLESEFWEGVARTLEAAKFDAAFFADGLSFYGQAHVSRGGLVYLLDPVPLAMNVLRATSHLGVGVTASTSFTEPFGLARTLGTVDHLSGGRLAWNVVTSGSDTEARQFGLDGLPDREARYDRATEVVEACIELWESFPADALIVDKQSGRYIDPTKLRAFQYEGEHVRTQGPLTAPGSPQGRPVIMQAGASERGRQFAAQFGEVIFTLPKSVADMRASYADIKRRVAEAGRSPTDCKILPGITAVVGETEHIARERLAYAEELLDDEVALEWTAASTGIDLTGVGRDTPLESFSGGHQGSVTYLQRLEAIQRDAGRPLTVLEAARHFCLHGFPTVVGSPEQVADQLQEMFESEAADGFVLNWQIIPGSIEDFTRMVVPLLQERGVFRAEYPGTTLRDTLRGSSADPRGGDAR
jgi:FMN-dependent oxidoreductase (nitrilotriacetate monooxygenase family)